MEVVASEQGISKAAAARAVEAVFNAVVTGLKGDGSVTLAGFGSFATKDRAARPVRNPSTGLLMTIEPSVTVRFRPSQALKDGLMPQLTGQ
ncbi:MAG: HU family DNA-binding protein [Phycisphaerae bacterium]|nr:HU family DNA-binding protein [Phycisphaerae bacterium]